MRLLKLEKALGRAIKELIAIVSPATFSRWVRDEKDGPQGLMTSRCFSSARLR